MLFQVLSACLAVSSAAPSFYGLVAHPNGAVVPVDEPAVAAARADHLATKGVYGGVYAAAGPVAYAAGYAPYAGLVAHPNGAVVPLEPADVVKARADLMGKDKLHIGITITNYI